MPKQRSPKRDKAREIYLNIADDIKNYECETK